MEYKTLLRRLKDELGISYTKMAELIGMNYNTLRSVMHDENKQFNEADKASIRELVNRISNMLAGIKM